MGTGLVGASVGLAAKRAGVEIVTGYDPDPQAGSLAAARGAVDAGFGTLAEAVAKADLVVVATPVRAIPGQVAAVLVATGPECTVTDVGSTKRRVCSLHTGSTRFVGGHPMAGSEASGPASASAELFDGAIWFLAPGPETPPERYAAVEGFVSSLGARALRIDPDEHDRLVALVSHLPHALANVLVQQAGSTPVQGHDPLAVAGASFRDLARVAGANRNVWVDVFLDNADALLTALARHRRLVEELESALREGDEDSLARWIDEAAALRARL